MSFRFAFRLRFHKYVRATCRPKFHSFSCEIVDRLRGGNSINPRMVACAGEEDLIGKLCSIIKGSVHASTFGQRALERAMLGLNVHLMELRKGKKCERPPKPPIHAHVIPDRVDHADQPNSFFLLRDCGCWILTNTHTNLPYIYKFTFAGHIPLQSKNSLAHTIK